MIKMYVNSNEVAQRYGSTPRRIRRWAARGLFPSPLRLGRSGRTLRWRLTDLTSWDTRELRHCEVSPPAAKRRR